MRSREIMKAVAKALMYGVASAVVLLGVIIALSGPSQEERRETARNVRMLVEESRLNRELLCLGIGHNPNNPARNDPRTRDICAEIGVTW